MMGRLVVKGLSGTMMKNSSQYWHLFILRFILKECTIISRKYTLYLICISSEAIKEIANALDVTIFKSAPYISYRNNIQSLFLETTF